MPQTASVQLVAANTSIHIKTLKQVILLLLGMLGGQPSMLATENQQRGNGMATVSVSTAASRHFVYCKQNTTSSSLVLVLFCTRVIKQEYR